MTKPEWIVPKWPAPSSVRALSTTRSGGYSTGPWSSFNLGTHCGDDGVAVRKNREMLCEYLPSEPRWLRQVHGAAVFSGLEAAAEPLADAQIAGKAGQVCVVLTADCLPVLFCNRSGTRVAAAHAGWRGLAAGILENTVLALNETPEQLVAWLGPAIGPRAYEVGDDVRAEFVRTDEAAAVCFEKKGDRWLFDLYAMARHRLRHCGVTDISGGTYCTFSDPEAFFSHRRDGCTGRMATLVWLRA